jgi:hypothetical protein
MVMVLTMPKRKKDKKLKKIIRKMYKSIREMEQQYKYLCEREE